MKILIPPPTINISILFRFEGIKGKGSLELPETEKTLEFNGARNTDPFPDYFTIQTQHLVLDLTLGFLSANQSLQWRSMTSYASSPSS